MEESEEESEDESEESEDEEEEDFFLDPFDLDFPFFFLDLASLESDESEEDSVEEDLEDFLDLETFSGETMGAFFFLGFTSSDSESDEALGDPLLEEELEETFLRDLEGAAEEDLEAVVSESLDDDSDEEVDVESLAADFFEVVVVALDLEADLEPDLEADLEVLEEASVFDFWDDLESTCIFEAEADDEESEESEEVEESELEEEVEDDCLEAVNLGLVDSVAACLEIISLREKAGVAF